MIERYEADGAVVVEALCRGRRAATEEDLRGAKVVLHGSGDACRDEGAWKGAVA